MKPDSEDPREIAAALSPLAMAVLVDCCDRGSTRANDGGTVDDLLSMMCSHTARGISNGWLVRWDMNPASRTDGYISIYTPTELGRGVAAIAKEKAQ